jgi:hypothetical protein
MMMNMKPHVLLAAAIGAALIAYSPAHAANAVQPPAAACRPTSKIEYESAKKQYLSRTRLGAYVRTGRIFRRRYWYGPG